MAISQPPAELLPYYAAAAAATGVPEGLLIAQDRQESGFRTDVVSPSGAVGIAQFMPGTAAGLGVNPRDPASAIMGQARLMGSYLAQYGGDVAKALAAYNAGPGAVAQYGGVPPFTETQDYVAAILTGWTGQSHATDAKLDTSGNVTLTAADGATLTRFHWPNPVTGVLPLIPGGSGVTGGVTGAVSDAVLSAVKDAVNSAFSALFNAVRPVVLEGVLVAGGVGLIIAGAWRSVSSAQRTLDDALDPTGAGGAL